MSARKNSKRSRAPHGTLAAACLALALSLPSALVPAAARAETPEPHWAIVSIPAPTYFKAGDEGDYIEVIAMNDGAAPTDGSKFTIADTLPSEVTATSVAAGSQISGPIESEEEEMNCPTTVTCEGTAEVPVGGTVVFKAQVSVGSDPPAQMSNSVTISGGGAETATAGSALTVSSEPVPFGASISADAPDPAGTADSQAGSHPVGLTTLLNLNIAAIDKTKRCQVLNRRLPGCPTLTADAKTLSVAVPPGLTGNPTAMPQCSLSAFQEEGLETCPSDTQVGIARLFFYGNGTAPQLAAVYNIEPPPGQPAELGFTVAGLYKIPIFFHLRADGDYGLTAQLSDITEADPFRVSLLTIWGDPAASFHDHERKGVGCEFGCEFDVANPKPFLTLPTSCPGAPLPLSVSGDSWQEPLVEPFPTLDTTSLEAMTGCNKLKFNPAIEARPTTNVADSPSGLHVDVKVPQDNSNPGGGESPTENATAHLRDAVVTLPKGLTVNPSSAAGLEGCSPAQIGLKSEEGATPVRMSTDPANCPDASKLGTVEVDTQLIDHPLPGFVYLAKPYDNPFKSLLALYITVSDPKTGVVIKLAGKVSIAADGQLTTTVSEAPQVPFEEFELNFFGGQRAPLRTPAVCGEYRTTSVLTPWSAPESGPPATPSDPYAIEAGPGGHACAHTEAQEPNKPSFEAGTESPIAAAFSPFVLHLHREDGSQNFAALNLTLPPGLIGKLAGVGECPDSALAAAANKSGAAEQASPSCPASSHLGTANVGAGAGTSPYYVTGQAYLAGPYKGAPLSVAIVTPAVAGPFDLGTVVVRSALYVNPETAQVSVRSDPIPTQLQGIQLDIRSIDLKLDRNQFTLNPTNCERQSFTGEEISSLGNAASLTNPFQVGECSKLGFKPKLALKLSGKTKRTGHPALRAVFTEGGFGVANLARSQVTLPHSEFLDQAHIGTVCTRVQFAAGNGNGEQCPAASIYGHARAITPLLDQPVEGPVYLRSSDHKLPDLVAALGGQISVDLDGRIDTGKGGGIRNTFEVVPDAPVTKFTLELQGAKKGLLVNSENICSHTQKALAHFVAQNGKVSDFSPTIANSCKSAKKHHKRRGAHR